MQRAIFNSANFSSIATDAKGVIQIFNVGAERMLGYAAVEVVNTITPADISDPAEVIARATALSLELGTSIAPGFDALVFKASRGIEDIYQLTYIRKDGSRFPAVVSVTALREPDGAIIGYLLIGTDNTARKHAEEALLENYALLRTIHLHSIVSVTDRAGVIVDANDGFCKISGYRREELLGQTHRIVNSGVQSPAFWKEMWRTISSGQPWRGEICNRSKDGSFYWVDSIIAPFKSEDGATKRYISVRTDVTARKLAEEALVKAGALQSAIFNSANFSSIATDARGVIQIFNVGAERMLGYAAIDVMNKITPADISDPQEVIARATALSLELGTPITPGFEALVFKASRGIEDIYELTYIRKDGTRFPAVVSVTALRDPQDAIIGYLLIGTDNTARRAIEAELKRVEHTVRQNEAQREHDAEHARALGLVNQELEAFSYSVSHDLRAPLRHVHGYVEMLRAATEGQLSDKATRYLKIITDASVEMGELIDDLLDFSRVGRAEIHSQSVALGGLVATVIRGLEMATSGRNLIWKLAPLPQVVGDPSLLKQVLTNLIDNAIKYSRTRDPATIEIGCAGQEAGRIIIFVRDDGVGFDMEYSNKLFGVFQRLHRAEEFEGTGIGLATVRRIINRHGGRVWAEGALGHGATIYFTLEPTPGAEASA